MATCFSGYARSIERSLEDLAAEARYHRQRMDLYRARMYGPGETSPAHYRELQRAWQLAEERLRTARAATPPASDRPLG